MPEANLKQDRRGQLLVYLILFLMAFLFSLTTRFFPLSAGDYGHDAGIFAGVGYAMQNGRALYTEIWENKGPLLYIINLLGISINYYHGIYFLELLNLFVTFVLLYKTALVVTSKNKWLSVLAVFAVVLALDTTLEGGNLSEEYALGFLSAGQYFVIKFFYNDFKIKNYEIILTGACLMAVLLLRINIAAQFVALFLVVALVLIKDKKLRLLLRIIGFAALGCAVFALPFLIYLIVNGSLGAYFSTAILGVMGSFSSSSIMETVKVCFGMFAYLKGSGMLYYMVIFLLFFVSGLFTGAFRKGPLKYSLITAFLAFIINTFANSIAGVHHMHYFLTFIPIMLVPVAWLLGSLYSFLKSVSSRERGSLMIIASLVMFVGLNSLFATLELAAAGIKTVPAEDPISDYVRANSAEGESVQFIGGDVTLNYKTQRLPASKHIHFAAGKFNDEFVTEVAQDISLGIDENDPAIVMFFDELAYARFVKYQESPEDWATKFLEEYELQELSFNRVVYLRK